MKINITKKEYRILLEMLYLADWMMNSHTAQRTNKPNQYEELRRKMLSYYKEMDAEDVIEPTNEFGNYYEKNEFDEYIHEKFIKDYDENVFWDELIDRLALRDVINEIGIENYQSMEGIERIMKIDEVSESYANEFERHGLKHVKIVYADSTQN